MLTTLAAVQFLSVTARHIDLEAQHQLFPWWAPELRGCAQPNALLYPELVDAL
jgi:hypothetical protein